MDESKKTIEPLPESFKSIAEAGEFWDTHSLDDYWDNLHEVEIEVRLPRRRWIPLAAHLATQAAEQAHQEGISIETLINLWVAERLASTS